MIRTKACKKCGEVIFNINSRLGNTNLVCTSCSNITPINVGKYSTLDNKCNSCSNESFKIKVEDNKEKEHTYIECISCKGTPSSHYVDSSGNVIDRASRELLIIQDSINSLNNNVNKLEARIDKIEGNLAYLENDLFKDLSKKVNGNKLDINTIKYDVDTFSDEICKLNDIIINMENRIISSLYLFK